MTALTISAYVAGVRQFLAENPAGKLSELTAADVSKAVLGQVTGHSPATVRRYGCALRSFLRYCYLVGLVEHDMSAARVACIRTATVSVAEGHHFDPGQVIVARLRPAPGRRST